jgi:hypothetical protein
VDKFPDGWSCLGNGLAEYQKARRFPLGPFYISLYYRYALNSYGQKTPSPFSHGSDGTSVYREIRLGYFVVGVSTRTALADRLAPYIPFFRSSFWIWKRQQKADRT